MRVLQISSNSALERQLLLFNFLLVTHFQLFKKKKKIHSATMANENKLENLLSVGQLIQNCQDKTRATLVGLMAFYEPCTSGRIREFTAGLIEVYS